MITINGKSYNVSGSISINNGIVTVNGKGISDLSEFESKEIVIQIAGDVRGGLHCDNGDVYVSGSVEEVTTTNGNIECKNVEGNIKTTNGNVHCGDVSGKVSTVNGTIRHN